MTLGTCASRLLNPMGQTESISSIGTALNYEQIGTLDSSVDEFRAADHGTRELIVRDFLLSFKSTWQGDNFEKVVVETVRTSSAALDCSHTFLAYSPAPVWPNRKGPRSYNPKLGD